MSNERILVIEDSEALRLGTGKTLANAGYKVETVATAQEGIALAHEREFDLLLADIYLPDATGIDAFVKIREIQPNIAGVAMTGFSSWEVSMGAIRVGFAGFLVKPFPAEQLISAVAAALEQENLRRENARLTALVPLYELSRTFMGAHELGRLLQQVVTTARQETHAEIASLMLIDAENQELSIAAADGLAPDIVESQRRTVGTSIAGWVAEHAEPLIIAENVPLPPELHSVLGKPELSSALSLPLRARGEVIGVLNLSRLRGKAPFTRSDLELATVLAGQAAISIDQARLIDVMRTMSETSQRLAGALDLDDAAGTILEATLQVAQAKRAALWLVEDLANQLALFKTVGFSPEEQRLLKPPAFMSPPDPTNLRDAKNDGILWLPILRVDKKFGLIQVHLPSNQRIRPDRLGVLRTLAHSAATVIESHRLRAREMIAFREIDTTLRVESNTQQVLERLIRQIAEACGAQRGAIFIRDREGARLNTWTELGGGVPESLAQEAMSTNRPLHKTLSLDGARNNQSAVLAAPLTIGTRVEGAIVLASREARAFGPRHLNLLSVLSSSAALIVRNTQLYAWSEEKVITEERARMAREIHDGLAQDINFMLMRVQTLQQALRLGKQIEMERELEQLVQTLRRDVREVRQTIFALRPVEIETLGFAPAIRKLINDFETATEIKILLELPPNLASLSPKTQSALYRLTQESLNNIRKHAAASQSWVRLQLDESWASLTVRDNGKGFAPEQALEQAQARGSVGLTQMRERSERAGGAFRIESAPGEGTTVTAKLPLK